MLMNTDRFMVYMQTKDVYKDIANDFGKRFDTSNCVIERLLPKARNKKRIELMKDDDRICWTQTKNMFLLDR